ncbi:MAG: hypothetical protein JRJ84_07900 [Deltaproteobacteria bacterium]|nr:hypothetical protein [Deltaproteobacteria bacterium]
MTQASEAFVYQWAKKGDLNAFFALMLDNLLNLVILTALLTGFGYPIEKVFSLMIPGTALGVMVGDLVYTWLAYRLAHKTKNPNVTAMPLGLDTPSTIGIALTVLGPCFLIAKGDLLASGVAEAQAIEQAAYTTWYVGMAVMMVMGVVKTVFAFFGDWVRRVVPNAGLLGSLGGIGLALLAYLPLMDIFEAPIVGLSALGLVLYTLVARFRLPGGIPGAAFAVFFATALYYVLGPLGLATPGFSWPPTDFYLEFPFPTLGFVKGMADVGPYIAIAIPFGLLTIVGGINVTESARVAGDAFETRDILLTEAVATLIAGLCGGVSQSTPYIGHPAYKAMGARSAYTLATGLFVGLGGVFGYVQFVVGLIPKAAVTPILLFIGLEIVHQAYHEVPKKHSPAVTLAFLPILAQLGLILVKPILGGDVASFPEHVQHSAHMLAVLGNGFILTAMLWGGGLALLIDRELVKSAVFFYVCAAFTSIGLIHSVHLSGSMYLPWAAGEGAHHMGLIVAGYAVLGTFFLVMGLTGQGDQVEEEEDVATAA